MLPTIIGAVGNNDLAVVGVNWTASIMGAKFMGPLGLGLTSDAINAIEFTIQAKAAFASTGQANVRVRRPGLFAISAGRNQPRQCKRHAVRGGRRQRKFE